jgi:glycerol-3-phosphate acyltransferase PlsY
MGIGTTVIFLVCCYLLGCCTIGYYLVRIRKGIDIRLHGSGGVGAMNVGRELGWGGFAVTLVGDAAKGALAVWATRMVFASSMLAMAAIIAVVLGHIWPLQLGLRGGKGVATSLGAMLAYDLNFTLLLLALFVAAYLITRRWMLSGLAVILSAPLLAAAIGRSSLELTGLTCLVLLIVVAHRDHIRALRSKRGK